ncbi:DNA-directed RNA polymerase subunit isoform 1 [Galdieria sulphuraria]|uniref:DNA-directed RNA polymerase subunit beta n=1 Tax=Galdieria sulphuraria TaxID=130081 RepID=M2X825_GALSU|nr:DNA-directed RNA polymerase subunit isoform 1 [Galdieria sulphuraria]EME32710.1 DNA-directed RNA polymerase subunit isoform 1 [Galdieria sulphuraria]|eukprot:XP_005709230.1 DNA-directed RNA polymerase subunit isoform 1 [Galdieria sulphuraria]
MSSGRNSILLSSKEHKLLELVKPHVESFDYFLSKGLTYLEKELQPLRFILNTDDQETKESESKKTTRKVHFTQQLDNNSSESLLDPQNSDAAENFEVNQKHFASKKLPKDAQDSFHTPSSLMGQTPASKLHVEIDVANIEVRKPSQYPKARRSVHDKLLPRHCRENQTSYKAPLFLTLRCKIDGKVCHQLVRLVGEIPVMVRSAVCHLSKMDSGELRKLGEEEFETGGYFICNGVEKVLRMIIVSRRNHIMAIKRDSNSNRGPLFSSFSCYIRCVRPDQTSKTFHLHYLTSGAIQARISISKQEYMIPVLLIFKALIPEITDRTIYEVIMQGNENDIYLRDRVIAMLMDGLSKYEGTAGSELAYLGRTFRIALSIFDDQVTDEQVGRQFLKHFVLIHLSGDKYTDDDNVAKLEMLALMIRKLIAVARGSICPDSPDSLAHQEVLLPGHLYMMYLKEKIEDYLLGIRSVILKDFNMKKAIHLEEGPYFATCLQRCPIDIGKRMEHFIATGQLQTRTGLDLMQTAGYSVVAERISYYRYISHFRCVHRGQFFSELKTTSVRKLLPEAWGFLCPVHTPDGAPCGLLNHLAHPVIVSQSEEMATEPLLSWLVEHGMTLSNKYSSLEMPNAWEYPVVLDGKILGYLSVDIMMNISQQMRILKVNNEMNILPKTAEIVTVVRQTWNDRNFPGLFIFTGPARLLRPVWLLLSKSPKQEYIGPLEQAFLRIANPKVVSLDWKNMKKDESVFVPATHEEIDCLSFLSLVASLTPFSDMNQSPRNMYQCQMSKQSLGTPYHLFERRSDSKMYRLVTPQIPIVRNFPTQDSFEMDHFPNGFNAVVAVLSYTGYDMEDAMVINKASLDRGLAHGTMYSTQLIDLDQMRGTKSKYIGGGSQHETIGEDGLPEVGVRVFKGDPLYCIADETVYSLASGTSEKVYFHKQADPAIVDQVRLIPVTSRASAEGIRRASIKLRYPRIPVIGDKFASRHGQKGVLSALWPSEDMPFTENGIVPDIIFNPNGFPSRMTIGMMMESICGKAGALHGMFQDSTPFRFDEDNTAVDYFGEQLRKAGFNFYGNEVMYSGYTGEPFQVDIFIGVIHYQRLRHMVSDKFQVRSTGPINPLTRQPVKGRKVGGAIRFGEMERDALLAHGAAYLLHDRLQLCSDLHTVYACEVCTIASFVDIVAKRKDAQRRYYCLMCSNIWPPNWQQSIFERD